VATSAFCPAFFLSGALLSGEPNASAKIPLAGIPPVGNCVSVNSIDVFRIAGVEIA